MSDQQNKNANKRYIGKMRGTNTQYGPMFKIYMDNLEHQNKDGSPNKYYKGALIWVDAETGKTYQVRQLSLMVPRNGMKPEDAAKGNSHFITLDLDDKYEVTPLD